MSSPMTAALPLTSTNLDVFLPADLVVDFNNDPTLQSKDHTTTSTDGFMRFVNGYDLPDIAVGAITIFDTEPPSRETEREENGLSSAHMSDTTDVYGLNRTHPTSPPSRLMLTTSILSLCNMI